MIAPVLPESAYIIQEAVTKGYLDKSRLKSIEILELGCGSTRYPGHFMPSVCRDLHYLGYKITGADILDNSHENFPNVKIDISSPENLLTLGKSRFDLVFDDNFTGDNPCTYLERNVRDTRGISWSNFLEHINQVIGEILTPGGIYIRGGYRIDFFQKQNGKLQKAKNI